MTIAEICQWSSMRQASTKVCKHQNIQNHLNKQFLFLLNFVVEKVFGDYTNLNPICFFFLLWNMSSLGWCLNDGGDDVVEPPTCQWYAYTEGILLFFSFFICWFSSPPRWHAASAYSDTPSWALLLSTTVVSTNNWFSEQRYFVANSAYILIIINRFHLYCCSMSYCI